MPAPLNAALYKYRDENGNYS
ncbi:hypothetical protein ACSL9E_004290 [Vibrio vulnificus]